MSVQATGEKYACKVLPGKNSHGDRRSHIITEIAIMQRAGQHPYSLSFHDAYYDAYDGTKYYLIMDLCTGGELFDQIVQKVSWNNLLPIHWSGSLPAVRDLACGLHHRKLHASDQVQSRWCTATECALHQPFMYCIMWVHA